MSKKMTRWNIVVPIKLDQALQKIIDQGFHATKSDFIRDCVRRRIEKSGLDLQLFDEVQEIRPISTDESLREKASE